MPIRRKAISKERYSALTGMHAEGSKMTPELHDARVLEMRKRMGRRGVTGEPASVGKTVSEQESELVSRRKTLYKKLRATSPSKYKKLKELGYAPKE